LNKEWDGYQVTIRNYVDRLDARLWDQPAVPNDGLLPASNHFPAWLGHQNVRLFRRDSSIRFIGRVHESVGPSLEAQGKRLGTAAFLIHHLGFVMTPEREQQKSALYRELGRLKLQDAPDNAQAHFEVGLEELTRGGGAGVALGYFVQSCRINPSFAVAWLFGAISLAMLGHTGQAEEFLQQAESLGYRSPLMLDLRADLMYRKGDYAGASEIYRRLLCDFAPTPEAESKLGLALWRAGEIDVGLEHLHHAIQAFSGVSANYDRLISVLVAQRQPDAAIDVAEARLRAAPPQPSAYLGLASLYAHQGRWAEVRTTLQAGCRAFPNHADLCRAAVENGVTLPKTEIHDRKKDEA
jgi:tetratricopeptide (TPR) repeat protein